MRKTILLVALLAGGLGILGLASCSNLNYYAQCVTGHLGVMSKCRPIPEVIADPETPEKLKGQLTAILEMRDFASLDLLLPENGSYRSYADLKRPYVVWNVVAAPEFSLDPLKWCFPVAGCVSYRGYFKREAAERFGNELRRRGNDVHVYGVSAYSTLNWFDDPVLNTFCNQPEPNLAGLIFHELAHQKLYIPHDSSFNEAFAKTVELEGVSRWLRHRGNVSQEEKYLEEFRREEEFVELVLQMRRDLSVLYASGGGDAEKRRGKERIISEYRKKYHHLKDEWGGNSRYDRWFGEDVNNAKLASVSTYRTLVPAFRELLGRTGGDLHEFYAEVEKLAKLSPEDRSRATVELLGEGRIARPAGQARQGREPL